MAIFRNTEAEILRELIDELKKAHAEELKRAITEIERLRDENQRLVLAMHPVLQTVTLPKETDKSELPPPVPETPAGTPWQRVQAHWAKQLEEEAKTPTQRAMETMVAAGEALKGENKNGSTG